MVSRMPSSHPMTLYTHKPRTVTKTPATHVQQMHATSKLPVDTQSTTNAMQKQMLMPCNVFSTSVSLIRIQVYATYAV